MVLAVTEGWDVNGRRRYTSLVVGREKEENVDKEKFE
jgi:hypothetical protein